MPIGIDSGHLSRDEKSSRPVFLYVGRLARSKRVHDVIHAFGLYRAAARAGMLHIVGTGEPSYIDSLKRLVHRLSLQDCVVFEGLLSRAAKHQLMSQAHALLMASVREGWGLVVTEANSFGTPAVVYDVPGLRDSVRNGLTGLTVEAKPMAMAQAMLRLWTDSTLHYSLAKEARVWSETFSFEKSTATLLQEIDRVVNSKKQSEGAACS
jgi:glycosyltransferase involved in cell wall biosynthesis